MNLCLTGTKKKKKEVSYTEKIKLQLLTSVMLDTFVQRDGLSIVYRLNKVRYSIIRQKMPESKDLIEESQAIILVYHVKRGNNYKQRSFLYSMEELKRGKTKLTWKNGILASLRKRNTTDEHSMECKLCKS